MAEHVKVVEEILPADCMYGECDHAEDKDDCPLVSVEVCSECREFFDDGDLELLTPWAEAEARGHTSQGSGVAP